MRVKDNQHGEIALAKKADPAPPTRWRGLGQSPIIIRPREEQLHLKLQIRAVCNSACGRRKPDRDS